MNLEAYHERLTGLEGFRGVAALVVVIHHLLLAFYPLFYFGPHSALNAILNADLAVNWFFVHSGLVLSRKVILAPTPKFARHYLYGQMMRRYFRLVPPVLASILFTWALHHRGLLFNKEFGTLTGSQWLAGYIGFTPTSLWEAIYQSFYGTYFAFKSSTTYNPSLWTIAYELWWSYAVFAVLLLTGVFRYRLWPLALLLLSPLANKTSLCCFFLGVALNLIPEKPLSRAVRLILTIIALVLADLPKEVPYRNWWAVAASGLLMISLLTSIDLRKRLEQGIFKRLGEWSYSLYVLHMALIFSLVSGLGLALNAQGNVFRCLVISVVTLATLLPLSYICWRFVDVPGQRLAKKMTERLGFLN